MLRVLSQHQYLVEESRAAMAKMSAHETVPQHSSSRASLMSLMIPNPRSVFTLGRAPFSLTISVELSSSTDPSHPCKQDPNKFGRKYYLYRDEAVVEEQAHKRSSSSRVMFHCFGHNLAHYLLSFGA